MSTAGPAATFADLPHLRAWFGDVVLVLFLCTQLLDGLLTYVGVAIFGVAEGNPLIAHSMHHLGVGASLTAAKMVAVACAVALHVLDFHRLLAVLTMLYVACAIVPWTFVLVLLP